MIYKFDIMLKYQRQINSKYEIDKNYIHFEKKKAFQLFYYKSKNELITTIIN